VCKCVCENIPTDTHTSCTQGRAHARTHAHTHIHTHCMQAPVIVVQMPIVEQFRLMLGVGYL